VGRADRVWFAKCLSVDMNMVWVDCFMLYVLGSWFCLVCVCIFPLSPGDLVTFQICSPWLFFCHGFYSVVFTVQISAGGSSLENKKKFKEKVASGTRWFIQL